MTSEAKQQQAVWWVLWAAFQVGIFVIYHFLGGTTAHAQHSVIDSPVWFAGFAPFAISSVIRWIVFPRAQSIQAALPLFIIGIAMAEATCFLGLFVFPTHKEELFALSVLGIFQFIPFFARSIARGKQCGPW